jgi:hypothetical protein
VTEYARNINWSAVKEQMPCKSVTLCRDLRTETPRGLCSTPPMSPKPSGSQRGLYTFLARNSRRHTQTSRRMTPKSRENWHLLCTRLCNTVSLYHSPNQRSPRIKAVILVVNDGRKRDAWFIWGDAVQASNPGRLPGDCLELAPNTILWWEWRVSE